MEVQTLEQVEGGGSCNYENKSTYLIEYVILWREQGQR